MTRTAAQIQRDIDLAQQRLDILADELERRKSRPEEPPTHSAIRFQVQYDPHGPAYSYLAYRFTSSGTKRWTLTGQITAPKTWDEVLDLMEQDVSVKTGVSKLEFYYYTDGKWVR